MIAAKARSALSGSSLLRGLRAVIAQPELESRLWAAANSLRGPVDPVAAVTKTGVRSPYYEIKARQMMEGDYAPRLAVDNAVKDLRLIAEAAADASLRLGSTEAAKAVLEETSSAGYGAEDMTALVKALRKDRDRARQVPGRE